MQQFLSDPDSGCNIAKQTLDENRFKHAQKTLNHTSPDFKVSDRIFFKTKQPGKWDLKWRAGCRSVCKEHNGHYLHTENQATGKLDPAMSRMLYMNH